MTPSNITVPVDANLDATSLYDPAGNIISSTNPLPVQAGNTPRTSITQTIVAVTATSGLLLAANANRKYLQWQVVGTNQVTITPGSSAAVYGSGLMFSSGGTGPTQGTGLLFDAVIPTDAFHVICNTGLTSTVAVWEGN